VVRHLTVQAAGVAPDARTPRSRRHRTGASGEKLAMLLGSMAAGRAAGGPGQLLRQGAKLVGQSPELGRLSDEIRGRLLDTAKVAAVAVATRQVEALTERVVSLAGTTVGDAGKTEVCLSK
ncbi:MAG TPA: hypothetical protein VE476_16535, partial [Propionibacteriaceae bacterium]|nr:hypothetical protein [Propionibacteriaceae bacterium]